MPVYDFKCNRCHGIFEKFYSIEDKPLMTTCLLCSTMNICAEPYFSRPPRIGHIDRGRLYSIAFGQQFKNEKQMMDYAKEVGCEPVGNEDVETIHKLGKRQTEENQEAFYKDIAEGIEWNEM